MYFIERLIIISQYTIGFISLCLIPKNKRHDASFIFLFTQLPAWILGLLVVEMNLIEYQVRLFSKANSTSFTFEYAILPVISIFFNLFYPEKKTLGVKALYYTGTMLIFSGLEHLTEKYTLLLHYIHWNWYYTFLSMCLVLYLVRVAYKWFFKLKSPFSL